MSKTLRLSALAICLISTAAKADHIVLKNGDRLTGAIVKSDGKSLTLKSEFAGNVTVPLEAVTQVTADQPLYVTLKDNQTLVGTIVPAADKLEVRTADAGNVSIVKDSIQSVRSLEEQAAYQVELDRMRNPGLADLWSGSVNAGLSLNRGNAETTTWSFGMNGARTTTRDKISVYLTTLYAENSTAGESVTTANSRRGGGRYDMNLSSRSFAFGMADLEYDEFQQLDLRLVLGGGLGWHAVKTERTVFDVFGGGSWNKEYFSTGLNRSSAEMLVGQELTHKMNTRFLFKERAVLHPNLSETGEFRLTFDASAITNLNTWLGWHVTFTDRYLSNPVPGTESNDVILTTGLRMTFGR
jgi:putative salt-induced outer membrane protein YdiY